jgi:hypothetical protein
MPPQISISVLVHTAVWSLLGTGERATDAMLPDATASALTLSDGMLAISSMRGGSRFTRLTNVRIPGARVEPTPVSVSAGMKMALPRIL